MGKIKLGVNDNDISSFAELRQTIRKLHPKEEKKEPLDLHLNGEPLEQYLANNNPKSNFDKINKFSEIIPDNAEQKRIDRYMHKVEDATPIDLTKTPEKTYEKGLDIVGIGSMPVKDVTPLAHKLHINKKLGL
ncbi:hypothetical protein HN924_00965 [Candidatus Woesearchaeota archaeon]|jgi:hypothetical protein|nr:hypothetical protein [Candidatus Woesearchaeota archaeon]MBT7402523.1 hypothetical protein [Candidatus Woesearchaeota archaeon]